MQVDRGLSIASWVFLAVALATGFVSCNHYSLLDAIDLSNPAAKAAWLARRRVYDVIEIGSFVISIALSFISSSIRKRKREYDSE